MPSKGGRRSGASVDDAFAPAGVVLQASVGAPISAGARVAFSQARSQPDVDFVPADEPPTDTPEWAELYSQAQAQFTADRERVEREQLHAHQLWQEFLRSQGEELQEGERSLVADDNLHQQLQRLARTSAAGEYERENVIGDPNQTFGIEIEFDGADPDAVARALYNAGLAATPHQEGYH